MGAYLRGTLCSDLAFVLYLREQIDQITSDRAKVSRGVEAPPNHREIFDRLELNLNQL